MKSFLATIVLAAVALGAVDVENQFCDEFTLSGYLDCRYVQFGGYNAVPSREFDIRRAGLETSALLTGNLKAELKLEFRPEEIFLKDALVEWEPLDFAQGRFGLFRRATLLGGDLSTWDLPLMERPLIYDLREELTYGGRDLGLDASFHFPAADFLELEGTAGVFNGDERGNAREDSELLYSFRGSAEVKPADLILGFSAVSQRQGMADLTQPDGYSVSDRLFAFSGDISISHSFSNWYDASLYGEASMGDNWKLCDVIAGEDPPRFLGYWGAFSLNYHPWNVQAIRTVSLSLGYDQVRQDRDQDYLQRRVSVIGAVYPTENIRIRFGGIMNTVEEFLSSDDYTDLVLEAGFRF